MSKIRYTARRVIQAIPVLLGITTITFLLINMIPGNPVEVLLGPTATPQLIHQTEVKYGLNQPLYIRYLKFLWQAIHGNLGTSLHYGVPVTQKIAERLPVTLLLLLSAFAFALIVAFPLGIASARRRNQPTDHVSRVASLLGVSTPDFWIGLLLIIAFSYYLNWFPANGLVLPWAAVSSVNGAHSRVDVLVATVKSLILPTITLGSFQMAAITRIQRSSMLEVLNQEYVKLARAYGVSERTILRRHAFRNAQLPVITIIGLQLTAALGGAVLTETVFNISGMGRLIITAVQNQDYPLIMGTTLYFGVIFVVGTIITDLLYGYLDPRVTYEGAN